MFNLEMRIIDNHQHAIKEISHVSGEIRINNFREKFDMPLDWWALEDYERQWREGLRRIITHGTSCLVARIKNPGKGPFVDWWLLYREDEKIYIRNEVLFGEEYKNLIGAAEFTVQNCYGFNPLRGPTVLKNGMQVSEWVVKI